MKNKFLILLAALAMLGTANACYGITLLSPVGQPRSYSVGMNIVSGGPTGQLLVAENYEPFWDCLTLDGDVDFITTRWEIITISKGAGAHRTIMYTNAPLLPGDNLIVDYVNVTTCEDGHYYLVPAVIDDRGDDNEHLHPLPGQ